MNSKETVSEVIDRVDNGLVKYKNRKADFDGAFEARVKQLRALCASKALNRLLQDRARAAYVEARTAKKIHDDFEQTLESTLTRTKIALQSRLFDVPPAASSASDSAAHSNMATELADGLRSATILGYVHTALTLVTLTGALEMIYRAESDEELKEHLKALGEVAGEVTADELAKWSGYDTIENILKVLQVGAGVYDILNFPAKAMAEASGWLDRIDAADKAIEIWCRDAQIYIETTRSEIAGAADDTETTISKAKAQVRKVRAEVGERHSP